MRSHVGVSPSGKATDSDSVIVGSNPATPAIFLDPLAQSVEHLTFNQGVPSSNLGWITTNLSWPLGQAVKTPPFHGDNMGSNPVGVTTLGRLAQLGERLPYKQDVGSSILSSPTKKEIERYIQ